MNSHRKIVLLAFLFLAATASQATELLDRVMVTVNSRIILESELQSEVQIQKMMAGTPNAPITQSDREAALERLMDRILLQHEMAGLNLMSASDPKVLDRLKEIRKQIHGADSDEGWRQMLAAAGTTEQELLERVADELNANLFIEARFRPRVHINNAAVRAYYQQTLLPEVRKRGAPQPALREVAGQIQEILVQQGVNELFLEWMKGLRAQATVRVLDPSIKLSGVEPASSLAGMNFLPLRISEDHAPGPAAPGPPMPASSVPQQ